MLQRLQSDIVLEDDDPYEQLTQLHTERINRITLFGELMNKVDSEAESVVPPQPGGDSTPIALPGERVPKKDALARLKELTRAVEELPPEATVQFVIGEE